ncbi:MAG: hypothetical protein CVU98_00115 [Firmicutes bacterium HGW-Firmicutes-3]|jgi:hypothetical protein|nr:MAG: hypothetical protein CVU98_00115 [Firmicutes bacterium HGW-Firmicutes-3]
MYTLAKKYSKLDASKHKLLGSLESIKSRNSFLETGLYKKKANLYSAYPRMDQEPFKDSIFSRADVMNRFAQEALTYIMMFLSIKSLGLILKPKEYFVYCKIVIPVGKDMNIFVFEDPATSVRIEPCKYRQDFSNTLSGRMVIATLEVTGGKMYLKRIQRTYYDLMGNILPKDFFSGTQN